MKRLQLDDYPWDFIDQTKSYLEALFKGDGVDRPGAILHPTVPSPQGKVEPPDSLTSYERDAWLALENLRRRPIGRDDFVPAIGTGGSTCAMATAFGAEEILATDKYWVKPCIRSIEEIDHLKKPSLTAGRLGEVLERTRAYAEVVDDRISINVMDTQSPFTVVEQLVGSNLFFTMPYDDPKHLHALMDLVTDFFIEFFQTQRAFAGPQCNPGGWPPIWFPPSAGLQMSDDNMVNVSPSLYEEFVVPYNSRVAEAFGGLFLHVCTITEAYFPVIKKIQGLTGINCDVSTSAPIAHQLAKFGKDFVVAPHAYINTDTNYQSYTEFVTDMLSTWEPGVRLFIYPCSVMYLPGKNLEIRCDENELRSVLEKIPGWCRDHPCATTHHTG